MREPLLAVDDLYAGYEAGIDILQGLSLNKLPEKYIETSSVGLDLEKRTSVVNRSLDFEPVSHNAGIGKQLLHFAVIIMSDFAGIEAIKRLEVSSSLVEDQ